MKPYPCCRHLHPAIDAVFALMQAHALRADEIERVDIETYGIAAEHAHIGWQDFASSQLSFPYVIATALRHGSVELPHFADAARGDVAVNVLCGRIHVTASAAMDERYRHGRPARVTVSAARELGADNIRVNSIAPGFTLSDGVLNRDDPIDWQRDMNNAARAIKRDQTPQDISGAVRFLCSDDATFITGQGLVVDGGIVFH